MTLHYILYNIKLTKELTSEQRSILNRYLSDDYLQDIKSSPDKRVRDSENHHDNTLKKAISLMEELGDISCKEMLEYHLDKKLYVKNEMISQHLAIIQTYLQKTELSIRDWNKLKQPIKNYIKTRV